MRPQVGRKREKRIQRVENSTGMRMTSYVRIMLLAGAAATVGCKSAGTQAQAKAPPAEAPAAENAAPPDGGVGDGGPTAAAAPEAKPAPPARPAEVKAKPDGKPKSFKHEVDGRRLMMTGQGARVRDGDKLYDVQVWIDETDARRAFPALAMRAGGRDKARLTRGDHAPAFLVWGRFNKQAVFKFARAVP